MTTSRPPIVFLNPWDRIIGPNRYLVEMLRRSPALVERAVVVGNRANDAAEEYDELGCRTAVWPEVRLLQFGLGARGLLTMAHTHSLGLVRLARRLRALRPAAVVSNTENLWVGGLAARWVGVPHLQIFHAMTLFERLRARPKVLSTYLGLVGAGCRQVLAVSSAQAAALRQGGLADSQIVTVPNPIPVDGIEHQSRLAVPGMEEQIAGRSPVLVCAGRLGPRKGQDLLVEALAIVRQRFPELLCCFAGRAESSVSRVEEFHTELRRRIDDLGLGDRVRFLGEIQTLPAWLRRADLYVQPSRSESFGRVVAEALVCGTPVVAFDTGGIAEVAGPGARLVTAGDTDALADAILAALEEPLPPDNAVTPGQAHVRERFAAGRVAGRFEDILLATADAGSVPGDRPPSAPSRSV